MRTQPVMRSGRAAVFAAVCVGLSAGAHLTMSGTSIPVLYLLGALLSTFYFARAAAGRERGLIAITAMMAGAQAVLHLWFAVGQYSAAFVPAPAAAGCPSMPGMPMDATGMCPAPSTAMGHEGTGMLLAHAAAALVCAWWLRQGEAAVFALSRRVSVRASDFLRRIVSRGPVPRPLSRSAVRARRVDSSAPGSAQAVLRFEVVRRGPPRWGAAF